MMENRRSKPRFGGVRKGGEPQVIVSVLADMFRGGVAGDEPSQLSCLGLFSGRARAR